MPTISTYVDLFGPLEPLADVAATAANVLYPGLPNRRRSSAVDLRSIDALLDELETFTAPATLVQRDLDPLPPDRDSFLAGEPLRPSLRQPSDRPAADAKTRTETLLASVDELRHWLGLSLRDVTDAAGVDRGTIYAWRREPRTDPRRGTIGSILRLHSVVNSAVEAVGAERARTWFHSGSPSPLDQLVRAHGDPKTVSSIGRRVRHELGTLKAPPPNPLLAASVDDLTEGRTTTSPWE